MNKSRKLKMYSKGDEEGKMKDIFGNLRNLESLKTKTHFSPPTTHISGITLVALVVTIVVLLILAGVTITALLGDDGIIKKAQNAADGTNLAVQDELIGMNSLTDKMNSILNGNGGGGTTPGGDETPQIPEGLETGSEVTYTPTTREPYHWDAEYATPYETTSSDYTTYDIELNNTGDFKIADWKWKVLSIDETTGQVELIASAPTTGTVRLHGAQGYNNAVKLLNDACDRLYGDDTKGIEGRSVDIDDIEKYMTETALTEAHQYANEAQYGNQVSSAYSSSESNYPVIYAQEKKAVITKSDGNVNNGDTGLDLSEQTRLIERSEGTSTSSSIGAITTATSIQPYQTYWNKDATFMQTAFKEYKTGSSYYSLFMPSGTSTNYWMASRCVITDSSSCYFYVSGVYSGLVHGYSMYYSGDNPRNYTSRALFPVITLSSELIEGDATSGFVVGDGSQSP